MGVGCVRFAGTMYASVSVHGQCSNCDPATHHLATYFVESTNATEENIYEDDAHQD